MASSPPDGPDGADRLTLAGRIENVRAFGDFARAWLAGRTGGWMPGSSAFAFDLVVAEAVSNAIRHGCPCDGGTVTLALSEVSMPVGNGVLIEVSDCGRGFDPHAVGLDPAPDAVCGRGILLIRRLCDSLEYVRGEGEGSPNRLRILFSPRAAEDRSAGIPLDGDVHPDFRDELGR